VYVVTFEGFRPSPRYDSLPWTHVTIDESLLRPGPYLPIDDIPLSPLDADPTNPSARSFTSDSAQFPSGWYRVTFLDAAGKQQPVEEVERNAERTNYMPTVGDVGLVLRARTKDSNGVEQGTFTDDTRPTDDAVAGIIEKAADEVLPEIGLDIPDVLWKSAANLISIKTAMMVELSYFPEQIRTDKSPYRELKDLYTTDLASLIVGIKEYMESGLIVAGADVLKPYYFFPDPPDYRW
jgi:hypothetical protein